MIARTEREDRLLSAAAREMVARTRPPAIDQMSQAELEGLGKRLRTARSRASDTTMIGSFEVLQATRLPRRYSSEDFHPF